jgi:uncharacterized protein
MTQIELASDEQQALDLFGTHLRRRLPGVVERVELFGSKARGDSHPESDIDILVVLDAASPSNKDAVYDAVMDTLLARGIYLSVLVYDRTEYDHLMSLRTPFMQNVAQEGIVLWSKIGEHRPPETVSQ